MNRPCIFVSAVSEELQTARQAVAGTLRTLGFDPVFQNDFPTGYGELRKWLDLQLDPCEGLIQLVGNAYGAEPPGTDPEHGRVSYTQLEFLSASSKGKKTWVIVMGKDFPRDKSTEQLDVPRDSSHPDPKSYQAERRTLQANYITRLKQANHLRYTVNNIDQLELTVRRLHDELGELRKQWEAWLQKDAAFKAQQTEASRLTTEKIRAHLLQTAQETHRREMAEADQEKDWRRRQALRVAVDNAQALRLSRIEELTAAFADIEGRGTATSVFQELTRILAEQGVDEAIAYVESQRGSILQVARSRAASVREQNRADLQPLLQTASLYQAKGQAAEARTLYSEILSIESDWPEALQATFWFLIAQGDLARDRTTQGDAWQEYEEAHRLAQHLTARDPANTEWQRDLSVSQNKIGDVLVAQGDGPGALTSFRKGLAIREGLAARDPANAQWQVDVAVSCAKLGTYTGLAGSERRSYLQRGLKIQQDLSNTNRLAPNQNWIGWFEERLAELDGTDLLNTT
ncbi:MAG: DUF4062 domain-containing protein [Nitrospira sp.]